MIHKEKKIEPESKRLQHNLDGVCPPKNRQIKDATMNPQLHGIRFQKNHLCTQMRADQPETPAYPLKTKHYLLNTHHPTPPTFSF